MLQGLEAGIQSFGQYDQGEEEQRRGYLGSVSDYRDEMLSLSYNEGFRSPIRFVAMITYLLSDNDPEELF